jgi:putative SOS response-associated peptidase YedK
VPIILADEGGVRRVSLGTFALQPRRHIPAHLKPWNTMNARAETIAQKPSYETDKAVRWEIGMADDASFAVAGLWKEWPEEDGSKTIGFTQITVNADEHPLMKRFHKPNDEKRSLVIVLVDQYDDWLSCRDTEVARSFLSLYPAGNMTSREVPIPTRKK